VKHWTLQEALKIVCGPHRRDPEPCPFPGKYPTRLVLIWEVAPKGQLRQYQTYFGKPPQNLAYSGLDRCIRGRIGSYIAAEIDRKNLVDIRCLGWIPSGKQFGLPGSLPNKSWIGPLREIYHPDLSDRGLLNGLYPTRGLKTSFGFGRDAVTHLAYYKAVPIETHP